MKVVEAVNLWGESITLEVSEARRKPTPKRGYAAPPGTGPAGETCGTCQHIARTGGGARTYLKCKLMKNAWTNGPGTDIRARSAACSKWEKTK